MTQNVSFIPKDITSLTSLKSFIKKIQAHLERVNDKFNESFYYNIVQGKSRSMNTNDIIAYDRLVYIEKYIVECDKYSDLKYGFQLSRPNIYVSIWLDRRNTYFNEFNLIANSIKKPLFKIDSFKTGIAIEIKEDLSTFQNSNDMDYEIAQWFRTSFELFTELIRENNSIKWKFHLPPKN